MDLKPVDLSVRGVLAQKCMAKRSHADADHLQKRVNCWHRIKVGTQRKGDTPTENKTGHGE